MGIQDIAEQQSSLDLLRLSLERGRLGHAYLFKGADLAELESVAQRLAKTLICEQPPRRGAEGLPLDYCDRCVSCRKVDEGNHPDAQWIRPESKSRVITAEQMRNLMQSIYLKPTQARYKVATIVGADRLNVAAANAFLKTLEEPPADSVIVLLTTEPHRILETIVSRCLRLSFSGENRSARDPGLLEWLERFSATAEAGHRSLLSRYQLLAVLLDRLVAMKAQVEEVLTKKSPLERYEDIEQGLKEKWEAELTASVEAEYRRKRSDLLAVLQGWLRDIWLSTLPVAPDLLTYSSLAPRARVIAGRISTQEAVDNVGTIEELQRLLMTNVQEALAIEVGLLKLRL